MANKKNKKQSVKSSISNKTSKKSPDKSGGASKSDHKKSDKSGKKIVAKAATALGKKVDEKLKKASPKEQKPVAKKDENLEAKKPVKGSGKITKPTTTEELAKTAKQQDSKQQVAANAKKTKPSKSSQKVQKESSEMDDDFLSDDVESIEDIGEYEEELKAVEEADEETDDETAWDLENKENSEDEIILTDAEGRRYCRARDCDQISAVDAYCRYHYLLFWKKIQIRKKILTDGKLERYVEELTSRYPDKFLEMIRRDLRTTKDFLSAIQELEIDESASADNDFEEESQSFIDEVRGLNDGPSMDEEEY